ncbi:hypothetical protein PACID_25340 [Acidipropionibacterium acidipropionici ATCC 4875]|uniref:Uncharacterized protein n=1 Tax=Acidipropionibacterium acidipropionici (strain ATCC 4875 / DSM 20272 / JCM 6432 / NBRC 12425 / NCIMB 8070 / 4) TaxID=1171373 RepID=K7SM96_ACIA4|nr:hypothetical protein PACID_25340 [Acidipropionibacterium acidipropionici ATCC 4875]
MFLPRRPLYDGAYGGCGELPRGRRAAGPATCSVVDITLCGYQVVGPGCSRHTVPGAGAPRTGSSAIDHLE